MRSLFIEEPRIEGHTEGKFVFRIELPATDASRCVVSLHHNAVADAVVQTEHPHRGFQSLIHHRDISATLIALFLCIVIFVANEGNDFGQIFGATASDDVEQVQAHFAGVTHSSFSHRHQTRVRRQLVELAVAQTQFAGFV